jgi:hypothetical protein
MMTPSRVTTTAGCSLTKQRHQPGIGARSEVAHHPAGDGVTAQGRLRTSGGDLAAKSAATGNVGIEEGHQRVEVTNRCGGDELLDHPVVFGRLHVRADRLGFGAQSLTRSRRELTARGGGTSDDVTDLVEGQLEDVVENEHGALCWREPLEHGEERGAHSVVERYAIRGVDAWRGRARVGGRGVEVERPERLTPGARGAEVVETETPGDDDKPAAHVVDAVEVRARKAHERFLDHVFSEAHVAQRAEGDVEKMASLAARDLVDAGVEVWADGHVRLAGVASCGCG